jgi:uncharacterized membrane protein YphA (DoxX/SURF4 family)
MRTHPRLKNVLYWVTTILGPASFVMGGVIQMNHAPEVAATLNHLGYPLYFATILGIWKILGAVATVVPGLPRLKEWAYAGFVFDLTAAAASHAYAGDAPSDIIAPLVFLVPVLLSWALRPDGRRLVVAEAPRQHDAFSMRRNPGRAFAGARG